MKRTPLCYACNWQCLKVKLEQIQLVLLSPYLLQKQQMQRSDVFSTPAHTFSEHEFHTRNYTSPTFCAHCTKLLVGLYKQGVQCKRCEVNIHKKCKGALKRPCIEVILGNHNFVTKSYKTLTYCDYCSKLLVGVVNQGLQCTECEANVHEKCQDLIEINCDETANRRQSERSMSRGSIKSLSGSESSEKTSLFKTKFPPLPSRDIREDETPSHSSIFETMPPKKQLAETFSLPTGIAPKHHHQARSHSLTGDALSKQVERVTEIMEANVVKLQERDGKLENLEDKTDDLAEKSKLFHEKSAEVKKKYWWKNKKYYMIIGVVALLLIISVIVVAVIET